MSVEIREAFGAVLNHAKWSCTVNQDDTCTISQMDSGKKVVYSLTKDLFEVHSPFYMDSQSQRMIQEAAKGAACQNTLMKETSAQIKRRKKKPIVLEGKNQQICDLIDLKLKKLMNKGRELNLFLESTSEFQVSDDNNKAYRLAGLITGCGDKFQELSALEDCHILNPPGVSLVLNRMYKYRGDCLINRLVENPYDTGIQIKVDKDRLLILGRSRFLMSTFDSLVSQLWKTLMVTDGYDCMVLDPPWHNKSVKRKKSYSTFTETELSSLPVSSLMKSNGLVCVWVTNNDSLVTFVKDNLFPAWNVEWVADWFWMKVTKRGQPVCDLRMNHKKPYERLIIGRLKRDGKYTAKECYQEENCNVKLKYTDDTHSNVVESRPDCVGLCNDVNVLGDKTKGGDDNSIISVPQDFVFVSVPCSLHSKKPPLSDLLSPYLPSDAKCLELFARNLLEGWTSWGNEVLRHQHTDFYDPVT